MTNNYDVQIWHVADTGFNAFWKQNPFFVHRSYLSSYCLCALNWLLAFNRLIDMIKLALLCKQ